MGAFSKQTTATSPAMQQYEDNVNSQVGDYLKTWQPMQAAFREQNDANHAGLKDQAEGQAVNAADLQAKQVSAGITQQAEARGAAPGSGAYTATMEQGGEMAGAARSAGLTGADLETQNSYMAAVQKALSGEQSSAQMGLQGLASAANQEQAEAGITTDINNSRTQQVGQISTSLGGAAMQHSFG